MSIQIPLILCHFALICGTELNRDLIPSDKKFEDLNDVLPNVRNSLKDCPLYYYKYGSFTGIAPVGGVPAFRREFAHMAAIGWTRQDDGKIDWHCGGSLITPTFILTAAHCTSYDNMRPDIARVGDLNLASDDDNEFAQQERIVDVIKHEKHKFASKYHDIALLKLENSISIHDTVCPACLWNDASVPFPNLEATGWGATGFGRGRTSTLLKVILSPTTNSACDIAHEKSSALRDGIIESQICAGHEEMDTCPGDSGGPLEAKLLTSSKLTPFIVGVTSFGKACGFSIPAVYTRVSSFVPWIELKTNVSFDPIECALRHSSYRDFEPDIIQDTSRRGQSLDLTKAHIQLSRNPASKVSLGHRIAGKFKESCSGILIANSYVLTTASCTFFAPTTVEVGNAADYYITSTSIDLIEIETITAHPQFNPATHYHDVAIVQLKNEVIINKDFILPSCLWYSSTLPDIASFEGRGVGPIQINKIPNFDFVPPSIINDTSFLALRLNVIENDVCYKAFFNQTKAIPFKNQTVALGEGLIEGQMCAGYSRYFILPQSCELEYGNSLQSRLFYKDRYFRFNYGLNSLGPMCGFGMPAIFTRISNYVQWIDDIIFGTRAHNLNLEKSDNDSVGSGYLKEAKCKLSEQEVGRCVHPYNCQTQISETEGEPLALEYCSAKYSLEICCPENATTSDTKKELMALKRTFDTCTESNLLEKTEYGTNENPNFSNFDYYYFQVEEEQFSQYPHSALIVWSANGRETYGIGILISHNVVLAAVNHLLGNFGLPDVVRLDFDVMSEDLSHAQEIPIEQFIFHPDFKENIAIIRLVSSVRISRNVYPACIWENTTHIPFRWSSTGVSIDEITKLSATPLVPLYNAECKRRFYANLSDDELCGDPLSDDLTACDERPGNILQSMWVAHGRIHYAVLGFFSYVHNCGSQPAVYNRITPYVEWINFNIS